MQEQSGFLIYQAIYASGRPTSTMKERQAHLRGWVYAPFRMTDFLQGLLGEQERDLVIDIFDGEHSASGPGSFWQRGVNADRNFPNLGGVNFPTCGWLGDQPCSGSRASFGGRPGRRLTG